MESLGQFFMWNWCAQRLASVGADGNVLYEAAESHEISPDGLEYTFKIKDGIKFHDGTPLTAADVAFTWNTCLKTDAGSNSIAYVKPVKGSQASSTTTRRTPRASSSSTTTRSSSSSTSRTRGSWRSPWA